LRAYWWRGEVGQRINNFGDEIVPFILSKMGLTHEWAAPAEAELVITGSVLEQLPDYWSGTVCGAGKFNEKSRINLSDARVFALRGKLTEAGVLGLGHQKPVLGDPGLLAPLFVRQPSAKYDLGVVPHWTDHTLRERYKYGHYIDPRQPVERVIEQIAACKRVVSSSLHGLIVADAYGIPRQAEMPTLKWQAEKEGSDFKWRDYQSVYGDTDPHWGEMWTAPRHEVHRIQAELHAALLIATGIDLSSNDRRHPQVSLLVPFRDDGEHRGQVWNWLRRYWRAEYPEAEIIQGHDDGTPFSKAVAVNHAASLARGRTFLVIDADAYLPVAGVKDAADRIDVAVSKKKRQWFIPYSTHYRLSEAYTLDLLQTPPTQPVPLPPASDEVEPGTLDQQWYGHKFGAFAQMMPREAFELVGGMDPRFRGWGSEDISFLHSLDTLYAQHHVEPGSLAHFWHAKIGAGDPRGRQWVGQQWAATNSRLAQRYNAAVAEPSAMRGLIEERT
jgi:pyruvyltransferase